MSNSLVEGTKAVLEKMLTRMCQEQPKMWPRFIDPLLFSYREVPQAGTKFEPVYGHSVRGPFALLRELWEGDWEPIEDDTPTTYEHVINLRERLQETCKLAQKELEKAGVLPVPLWRERKVNAPLVIINSFCSGEGPFDVVKKANRYNYVIDVNDTERKYHINMVKRYHERFVKVGDRKRSKDVERSDATCDVDVMRDVISGKSNVIESSEQENEEDLVLACVAVVCEDYEGDKVITAPIYVQKDVSNVRVKEEFRAVFADVPGRTEVITHTINLTSDRPVKTIPYALQRNINDEVDWSIDK